MQPTPDEPEIPGVVGRRSARLSIIVPITVHGTDAAGQSFKENTWTISVNKQGGRIATFHRLAVDDQVLIENPLLGRAARGRVNRICEKRFAEDPFEVCVELLEAQNVWGVRLPPEDWEKERQSVLEGRKGLSPQAEPPPPATSAALPEDETKIGTAHLAPGGLPVEAGEQTGGLSQFNVAVHALTRLAGEAAAPSTQTADPRQESGPAQAPVVPAESSSLAAFESLQKTIHEAQSLREELNALLDRLQNAGGEAQNILSRAGTVSEEIQSQIEGARRSNEVSLRQSLEAMRREMQADALDAGTQARKICKEESGTAVKAISVCVDSAVDLLNRAGDEAAARLQGARQTLELSLKKAEESLPHLASESASYREHLRAALVETQSQQLKEMERGIQATVEGLLESLRERIESTAEETAARLAAEVRNGADRALQELPERFSKSVEMAVFVVKEWEQQTRTELEAHAHRLLEAFEKRLDASSPAAQKRQHSEAEAFKSMLHNFLDHAEALSAESTQAKAAARVESTEALSRPAQPSAEVPTPALEKLMEKQRKIIEDTLGAFRSKLSQNLAGTTSRR